MRALFLSYNRSDACSFYRSSGIASDLRRKTPHNITVMEWNGPIGWSVIMEYDLIMFQRPYNKPAYDMLSYIKQCNVPVWVDYDDNLLEIPPENKAHAVYGTEEKECIKKILALADVVTVTTEALKTSFSPWSDKIQVIPNAFNDLLFHKPEQMTKRSDLVLWRGTDTHIFDIMHLGGAINKITEEFEKWQFLFMGFYPWFLSETKNKAFMKSQDLIIYHQNIMKIAPAVMQVPLHDNNFNRCKSNIAAIEGAFAGAVSVVPSWWNIPSCLSYTDEQSYYDAIYAVLSGSVDVKAMNKVSWEFIMDNLRLSKVNILRLQILNQFL